MGAGILIPVENDRPAVVTPIPLGQAGFAYVEDELSAFGPLALKTLAAYKGKGRVFAPLEKGTSPAKAEQFEGGKDNPTVAIRAWIADYITLHWGKDCQLIAEDPWMTLPDVIRHITTGYFTIDNTPYYTAKEDNDSRSSKDINDSRSSKDDMEQTFTTAAFEPHSWGFAVFVIDPPVLPIATKKDIDPHTVELLVQNVKAVMISAYDHDGYVVWEI